MRNALIYSEVPSQHSGIRRKYETLKQYLETSNFKVVLNFNNNRGFVFKLGLDYMGVIKHLFGLDVLYLRNNTRLIGCFNYWLLIFLARLTRTKIFVEIPTWPFIYNEYKGIQSILHLINFRLNIIIYRRCDVNLLVCSPNPFEYDIRFIRITNWLSDWNYQSSNLSFTKTNDYDYVYVANMNKWHDPLALIDRFEDCQSSLVIVAPRLSQACIKKSMGKPNISICLGVSEDELRLILLNSKIGIDTIGRDHGNYSLKSRDYLNFGLGVVLFHHDNKIEQLSHVVRFNRLEKFNPDVVLNNFVRKKSSKQYLINESQNILNIKSSLVELNGYL